MNNLIIGSKGTLKAINLIQKNNNKIGFCGRDTKIEQFKSEGDYECGEFIIEKAENKALFKMKGYNRTNLLLAFHANNNKKLYISIPFYNEQEKYGLNIKKYWFIVEKRKHGIYLKNKEVDIDTGKRTYTKNNNRKITESNNLLLFHDELHDYENNFDSTNDDIECYYNNKRI